MPQMTLHLTPVDISISRITKKLHFNRFYRDTQRADFRPLEDKFCFCLWPEKRRQILTCPVVFCFPLINTESLCSLNAASVSSLAM
jgi:hypothetical protein